MIKPVVKYIGDLLMIKQQTIKKAQRDKRNENRIKRGNKQIAYFSFKIPYKY